MAFDWRDLVPDFIEDAFGDLQTAAEKPWHDKTKGLGNIQGHLDRLKKERMDRMESVYGRADAKFDDSRKAMAAMYGDPSMWRL